MKGLRVKGVGVKGLGVKEKRSGWDIGYTYIHINMYIYSYIHT
jgi:hypothetical protein